MSDAAAFEFWAALQERSGVSFDQDEAVIRLRVPKSEKANMVGVVALTDCAFRVRIDQVRRRDSALADTVTPVKDVMALLLQLAEEPTPNE